jgi:hypothetical protein
MKWNAGVNNFMTHVTGDMPAGAYQSTRLANLGLGHWAINRLKSEPQCNLDEGLSHRLDLGSGFVSDNNSALCRRMGSHCRWLTQVR